MKPWLCVDFETRSRCDLLKAGAYRYAADFSTEPLCLAFEAYDGRSGVWLAGEPCPALSLEAAAGSWRFIAHNVAFERCIWQEHMVPMGWPELPLERWACTMARANQLALPGGLDKLMRALRAPPEFQKDAEGAALIKHLSKPWVRDYKKRTVAGFTWFNVKKGDFPEITPEIRARVVAYCSQDIKATVWVHRMLGELPEHERPNWELTQRMNDRGIGLDMQLVRAMTKIVEDGSAALAEEFREITGGLSFTQVGKVKAWVIDQGVDIPNLSKQTLEELLGSDEDGDEDDDDPDAHAGPELHLDLPEHVARALRIRQLVGSASVKKLPVMEKCAGYDSRARGLMVYHGTGPGRQTAKLLQPHNFPRGSNDMQAIPVQTKVDILQHGDAGLVEAVLGPPVETVVSSLRHALLAAPGHVFVSGDYSGIQARTVLALAGQHDKAEMMANGVDVYIDMACDIWPELPRPDWAAGKAVFKPAVELFKEEHLFERQTGKNSVLGLGFQMAADTFQEKYARAHPLAFAEDVVDAYRKRWAPMVPKLWYGLQNAAVDEVWFGGGHEFHGILYERVKIGDIPFLRATIHNGTSIYYAYPEQQTSTFVSKYDGLVKERRAFTYWVQKGGVWRQNWAFGGQLTENVVMKIERELMERAKKRLDEAGFGMVLEVHDEALGEARDPDLDLYRRIMEDVDPWVKELGIPIQVDVWAGPRYRK